VDRGSVGAAARELRISQPALTQRIKRLEDSLGTPLFERTNNGMVLNPYGRQLLARAKNLSLAADAAANELHEMLDGTRGRINISVAPSFAESILPAALTRFRREHSNVEICATEDTVENAVPKIVSGELDFAIGTISTALTFEGVVIQALLREQVLIVSAADNPLSTRRHLKPSDLWQNPWVVSLGLVYRTKLFDVFVNAGLPPPEATLYYSSVSFAKSIVRRTNHVVMLSRSSVEHDVAAGSLRVLRAPDFDWERYVGVAFPAGTRLLPAAQQLLDLICESAALHKRAVGRRSLMSR
jgi:DNA-binding transcriptional LysR family regulator